MINTNMRILEILLPAGADKSLSPYHAKRIDALQKRMDAYTDKICDTSTSAKGREFLKSKLRNDYDELKDIIKQVTESEANTDTKYEVYDRKTGLKVGGPYSTKSRARAAVDRLDNKYGGYRYGHRPVEKLNEAVHKLPLTNEDFDLVCELMSRPIPAAVAPIYIQEIIDDDEFNSMLNEFADMNPSMDVRPHVVEWIKRVMPDQMYRFDGSAQTLKQRLGQTSVIHGYDPHMYHGSNEPITGNAYGKA
jgi:hypothetical protein